jgi:hypothetical protein
MGGNIGEVDFPLHIGDPSGINRVFLRAVVNDCTHVLCGGAPQGELIDLLKCQIALPDLFLVMPDTVVTQVELVHGKMQMCPIGRNLVENSFVTARVDKLSAKARVGPFEVDADLETSIHLADPIAREALGKS